MERRWLRLRNYFRGRSAGISRCWLVCASRLPSE
nr:MAG TPA: hypothetical protein [Caudoviricetes sp.]